MKNIEIGDIVFVEKHYRYSSTYLVTKLYKSKNQLFKDEIFFLAYPLFDNYDDHIKPFIFNNSSVSDDNKIIINYTSYKCECYKDSDNIINDFGICYVCDNNVLAIFDHSEVWYHYVANYSVSCYLGEQRYHEVLNVNCGDGIEYNVMCFSVFCDLEKEIEEQLIEI